MAEICGNFFALWLSSAGMVHLVRIVLETKQWGILGPYQTSISELICENSQRLSAAS